MRSSVLLGSLYCAGGMAIFAFLAFCLALHIRAQRVWAWHLKTGRVPTFRRHGFWRGAALGALLGLAAVIAAAWFGLKYAEHPTYGEVATMAFYGAWLYGVFLIGVLAVVTGWLKRAWDRTTVPES